MKNYIEDQKVDSCKEYKLELIESHEKVKKRASVNDLEDIGFWASVQDEFFPLNEKDRPFVKFFKKMAFKIFAICGTLAVVVIVLFFL